MRRTAVVAATLTALTLPAPAFAADVVEDPPSAGPCTGQEAADPRAASQVPCVVGGPLQPDPAAVRVDPKTVTRY